MVFYLTGVDRKARLSASSAVSHAMYDAFAHHNRRRRFGTDAKPILRIGHRVRKILERPGGIPGLPILRYDRREFIAVRD